MFCDLHATQNNFSRSLQEKKACRQTNPPLFRCRMYKICSFKVLFQLVALILQQVAYLYKPFKQVMAKLSWKKIVCLSGSSQKHSQYSCSISSNKLFIHEGNDASRSQKSLHFHLGKVMKNKIRMQLLSVSLRIFL